MTKRVTVSETNLPSAGLTEAFARLLLEREKSRPAAAIGGSIEDAARSRVFFADADAL